MASIPFIQDLDFAYGVADDVAPGVRRVICNNPGPFTYTGSGTYIVGRGEVAVIDPGPDNPSHLAALAAALEGEKVSHILITHTHADHCGGARAFAAMTGAPVLAYGPHPIARKEDDAPALDEGGDHGFRPDATLDHGDIVENETWRIEAVHTPGHLSNHLCFATPETGALFTGDHIMGWATTVVAPPDGDMSAYIASLDALLARDDALFFPTHGAPIDKPRRFTRAVKTHRLMRDAQIIDQIKKGRTTIRDIVPAMYADVDRRLHKAAALNVLAHLIRLQKIGEVTTDGPARMDGVFGLGS